MAEQATKPAAARLPRTGLFEPEDYNGPVFEQCDVLIVGSGPGGGTLAWTLAQSGLDVIVLEAGTPVRTFEKDFAKTLATRFWDGGMRTTRGNIVFPTLQVKALGGGSVYNAAICMRPNPMHMRRWKNDYGLDSLTEESLAPHFEEVERFFKVRPVPEAVMGRRNTLFREGAQAMGWAAEPIRRNEEGCIGSAECIIGCRNGSKVSLDRRGLPEHLAAGGRIYTGAQVEEVLMDRGRATGAAGRLVDARGVTTGHFRIGAKAVVLAAGAIGSPAILRRSGLRQDPIGGMLRFHPSGYLIGVFDEPVHPWSGATQGYHVTQFLDQGIKLESLWASNAIFAQRLPMQPRQFKRYLKKMDRAAVWDTWVSGDDSTGSVRTLPGTTKLDIPYEVGPGDLRRLQEGNALLAEMFAAAGATEVLSGIKGLPDVMDAQTAGRMIRDARLAPADFPSSSNHVMGGMCMGVDPKRSATDHWGQVHGVQGLYVADTSLYPSSPGVNPMLTAMALARRLGLELPNRVERGVRARTVSDTAIGATR